VITCEINKKSPVENRFTARDQGTPATV